MRCPTFYVGAKSLLWNCTLFVLDPPQGHLLGPYSCPSTLWQFLVIGEGIAIRGFLPKPPKRYIPGMIREARAWERPRLGNAEMHVCNENVRRLFIQDTPVSTDDHATQNMPVLKLLDSCASYQVS